MNAEVDAELAAMEACALAPREGDMMLQTPFQTPPDERPYFRPAAQEDPGVSALREGPTFRVVMRNAKAEELLGLIRAGDVMPAIDDLYDVFRRSYRARRFDYLESLVRGLGESVSISAEFAVAVLTATLPVKSRINGRAAFYQLVADLLRREGREPREVLHGLE